MSIVAHSPITEIPSGTWAIDPVWSALEFEVKKLGLRDGEGAHPRLLGHDRGRGAAETGGERRRHQHHDVRRDA